MYPQTASQSPQAMPMAGSPIPSIEVAPVEADTETVTITCRFKRVIYHNKENGYTVALYYSGDYDKNGFIIGPVTAVGTFLPCDASTDITLIGVWEEHYIKKTGKKERQFAVSDCQINLPTTEKAMITYLSSEHIDGCGKTTAEKIVKKWGEKTYEVLEAPDAVDQLAALPRLPRSKAERIVNSFLANTFARTVVTECAKFNISPNKALKLHKEYGTDALKVLRTTPYRICEIDGFGFVIADTIARAVVFRGIPFDALSLVRIKAGIMHILKQEMNQNGHLYRLDHELLEAAKFLLENKDPKTGRKLNEAAEDLPDVPPELLKEALESLINEHEIRVFSYTATIAEGESVVVNYNYLPYALKAEENVARFAFNKCSTQPRVSVGDAELKELVKSAAREVGFSPSQKQLSAAMMVLKSNFSIITGGPGTGKTSVIKTVIEAFRTLWALEKKPGECSVALAAPTGRAARRMTESCGYPAQTLHSLLGLRPDQSNSPAELNQIETDLLIVDEFSMVDMFLANHLTENISHFTKIVFVGDAAQLPSVGPGSVFAELIACNCIPVTELTEIFRQKGNDAGFIVENAARIRVGSTQLMYNNTSFQRVVAADTIQAQEFIRCIYDNELRIAGENAADKVQVLTPRRTDVATSAQGLNPFLREIAHNVAYPGVQRTLVFTIAGVDYWVGDKIMQLKNTEHVANGDIGYIVQLEEVDGEKAAKIDFGDGRVLSYSKKEMENIVHAYACTIHKSQGSEYDTVIIPLLGEHYIMLERALFYTAVTRAVKKVIVVTSDGKFGPDCYVNRAIKNVNSRQRNTLLCYRISQYFQMAQAKESDI